MLNCDMCGMPILNTKCSCGEWADDTKENPMRKAIEQFHEMKQFTLTADAPHLGCACVYFRGDYKDTKMVEKYIHGIKNRPFYGET